MITSTDRLIIRQLTIDDAIHFFNINNDPDCIAYTGDKPFESFEASVIFLSSYVKQYQDFGMGRWAICLKGTEEFVGWCGLKYHPKEKLVDIGYRLYKKHWGKGLATEATKACIDYGFNELHLDTIVAHVHIDNLASHRVALNSGLIYIKDFTYNGQPAKFYQIKKIDYLRNE